MPAIGLEPHPWREDALTNQPDPVLDLTFLATRSRGESDRFNQVMAAHMQEAAIMGAILRGAVFPQCEMSLLALNCLDGARSAGQLCGVKQPRVP
jgi:hypothetical protein